MSEELGKIEKPEAEQFVGKRKLFLLPLLFSAQDAPAEYVEKFKRYWAQACQHVANLEAKIGKVNHVYHESIYEAGEAALKVLEKFSPPSYQLVRDKCQNGAIFEATEDRELAEESMDWERFILMGFLSQKVAKMVSDFYIEAMRKRYEYIAKRIDETLKANEVGILLIREGHMVQFPRDVEVFSIAPPALDEIHRWQRKRSATEKGGEA